MGLVFVCLSPPQHSSVSPLSIYIYTTSRPASPEVLVYIDYTHQTVHRVFGRRLARGGFTDAGGWDDQSNPRSFCPCDKYNPSPLSDSHFLLWPTIAAAAGRQKVKLETAT